MATHYITNYGDDTSDGLSFKHSLKHMASRKYFSGVTYVSGYFEDFEIPNYNNFTMIGYTETIINNLNQYSYRNYRGSYYNLEFKNFDRFGGFDVGSLVKDCYFHDINLLTALTVKTTNNIFKKIHRLDFVYETGLFCNNNTIHDCGVFIMSAGSMYNCIISNTLVYMSRLNYVENNLIINCKFKFTGGGLGNDESDYTYPQGESDTDKLYSLRYRMVNVYGGNPEDYFINCIYYSGSYNDIFIDADNDDFHLIPGSVAEHISVKGGFVGAKEVGVKTNNLTFTNINGTSGLLIDENTNAKIETDIIDLNKITEIKNIDINFDIAYKNGHQVNYDNYLGSIIDPGLNVLINDTSYVVLNDIIEKNDTYYTHYNEFETFNAEYDYNYSTSGTSGSIGNGLGFETYENGKVQEILYEKSFSTRPQVNYNDDNNVVYGNADVNYSLFDAKPLQTRYIKIIVELQINNLKVR